MLEIDSVILEFGLKRVLQDVYLKVEIGKITGLLGRNGSGKSCLMNIIYGDLRPIDRSIRIDGKIIHGQSKSCKSIAYLPQYSFVPRFLSIKRIFKDFKSNFNLFKTKFPEFAKYFHSTFDQLSGGEQRVIEIYLVLTSTSRYCMLDEPFSHIMPVHVEMIKQCIREEKLKKGILISDHLYKHIVDLSDHLYVINNGKTFLTNNIHDLENLGYIRSID